MKGQKKITKMSKIDNIYKLLSEGERVTLECKKATKGVPSSLWDTYSAFANTYGGTILLGVVEHMNEHDNAKRKSLALRMQTKSVKTCGTQSIVVRR